MVPILLECDTRLSNALKVYIDVLVIHVLGRGLSLFSTDAEAEEEKLKKPKKDVEEEAHQE